jgi:hypothetical protein
MHAMARRIVAVLVAFILVVLLSVSGSCSGCGWFYSPPTGGEQFAATGKLTILQRRESPVEEEQFVRELTEQETAALRHFIENADYVEYPTLYKDFTHVPVVNIDGIRWWVYRSSLFRVEGGDPHWRKTVPGLSLADESDRRRVNLAALIEWYEREK